MGSCCNGFCVVVVIVDDADGDSVVFEGLYGQYYGWETVEIKMRCVLVLRFSPSAGKAIEYWAGPPWKVRWTVFRKRAR